MLLIMVFTAVLLGTLCGLWLLGKWIVRIWITADGEPVLIRVYPDLAALLQCRRAWYIPAGMVSQISITRDGLILCSGPYEIARIMVPGWLLPELEKVARKHFLVARISRVWDG